MYVLRWQGVWEIYCCFLPKSIISSVNGDNLIVEQFVFVCFQYSGQRREQTSNKMSARKQQRQEINFSNNDQHYNVLMTDWKFGHHL